ncbi:hypothetical protein HWV62_13461 [Athelia sp. TMB]|nr:hypothetical protein HWV62_13461 [Athelia sp. TMB]
MSFVRYLEHVISPRAGKCLLSGRILIPNSLRPKFIKTFEKTLARRNFEFETLDIVFCSPRSDSFKVLSQSMVFLQQRSLRTLSIRHIRATNNPRHDVCLKSAHVHRDLRHLAIHGAHVLEVDEYPNLTSLELAGGTERMLFANFVTTLTKFLTFIGTPVDFPPSLKLSEIAKALPPYSLPQLTSISILGFPSSKQKKSHNMMKLLALLAPVSSRLSFLQVVVGAGMGDFLVSLRSADSHAKHHCLRYMLVHIARSRREDIQSFMNILPPVARATLRVSESGLDLHFTFQERQVISASDILPVLEHLELRFSEPYQFK